MADREALVQDIHECLVHLHDGPSLEAHRLARLVGTGGGGDLQQALVAAIEQLRPPAAQRTAASAAWRRYRHLVLRYVEGRSRQEVVDELGISSRQATRDHEESVRALAAVVWTRYSRERAPRGVARGATAGTADLEAEMAQVATADEAATDLAATVDGVLTTIESLARSRHVRFSVDLPDALPSVTLSRTLLRQGLFNLLGYAVEACPGATLVVRGADTARGVELTLDARRGRGRPPSRQVEPGLPVADDLLAAARRLLEAEGVRVELLSGGDGDLLIDVVMPPVRMRDVLVIDDNPDVVALFRRYLRGTDFRPVHAGTAQNAVRLARDMQPAGITLDLMMPSLDGWEILEQLRRDPLTRGIPVVVCSALPENALARSLGVCEFLAKPVTPAGLLSALERCTVPSATARPDPPAGSAPPRQR